jgi:hypothetical protein
VADSSVAPYRCPTLCDPDCEINGWGCHEGHVPAWKREHDPDACEARALAGNLRWLADQGWQVTYGRLRDRSEIEPYWAMLTNAPTLKFQRQDGVGLGDVAFKARRWAEQRGIPGWDTPMRRRP